MLRNIAGIMADEEPRTAISASGLYNSSDLGSLTTNADLSSTLFPPLRHLQRRCFHTEHKRLVGART